MSKKLFVGGISWDTDEAGLTTAFSRFGNVREAKVIKDRETGRSRGFAFVEFDNADDAESARQNLDGTDLDGRTIKVDVAQERQRSGGGHRGGDRDHHGGGKGRQGRGRDSGYNR